MLGLELALAGHLLWHASADGNAGKPSCPVQKSAQVDVRWRSEPIKYDFSRNTDNLNHREVDTVNPYGTHVSTDVGGLMTGNIKYESNIQVSSIRYPVGDITCLWIDKVIIDVVIDPTILIAAEHPQGTCQHDAIMEHEFKHIMADRNVVKDHVQGLRTAASAAVQKVGMVGPKPSIMGDHFKQKMTEYIQDALKKRMDELYADRKNRQIAIDNKKEYDRVDAVCKGRSDK